jgi:hypothetical protein
VAFPHVPTIPELDVQITALIPLVLLILSGARLILHEAEKLLNEIRRWRRLSHRNAEAGGGRAGAHAA